MSQVPAQLVLDGKLAQIVSKEYCGDALLGLKPIKIHHQPQGVDP